MRREVEGEGEVGTRMVKNKKSVGKIKNKNKKEKSGK